MIDILGKKQKIKRNLLYLLCHNLVADHFRVLSWSPLIMLLLWVVLSPLGDGQRMKGQTTAVFLSHALSHSSLLLLLPPHLFLLLQHRPSVGHGPFGRAPAPAWAHPSATDPLLWSTSFCLL